MSDGWLFSSIRAKLVPRDSDSFYSLPRHRSTNDNRQSDNPFLSTRSTPNEPPPPYSAVPRACTTASEAQPLVPPADDRYSFLSSFDTMFLIDDSGSMAGRSWRETQAALSAITPICTAHDADGVDTYFLNPRDNTSFQNVVSTSVVNDIFSTVRPRGGTPTGQKLNKILKPYLAKYAENADAIKPPNLIVITDGDPNGAAESPTVPAAKKLKKIDAPAWQTGIQFFQVGNDAGGPEYVNQHRGYLEGLGVGFRNNRNRWETSSRRPFPIPRWMLCSGAAMYLPMTVLAQNPTFGVRVTTYAAGTIAGGSGYAVLRIPGASGNAMAWQILLYSGSATASLLYIVFLTKCWLSPKERIPYLIVVSVLVLLSTFLFNGGSSSSPPSATSSSFADSLPFLAVLGAFMAHLMVLVWRGVWNDAISQSCQTVADQEGIVLGNAQQTE